MITFVEKALDVVGELLGRQEVKQINVKRGNTDECEVLIIPKTDGSYQTAPVRNLLEDYRQFPDRREGVAVTTTLDSFIAHANRMGDAQSAVFLDDTSNDKNARQLIAVYDYHAATEGKAHQAEGQARNMKHRCVFSFPFSDEWKTWAALGSKWMDQATFAAFLEERIVDVLDPAAATDRAKAFAAELGIALASKGKLLELSRGLAINVDKKMVSKVNVSTGESQISYEETHSGKDSTVIMLPGGFVIAIPVFRGDRALFELPVRLRYRAHENKVVWQLAPHNIDKSLETCLNEAADKVRTETGLPVFRGRPEQ